MGALCKCLSDGFCWVVSVWVKGREGGVGQRGATVIRLIFAGWVPQVGIRQGS